MLQRVELYLLDGKPHYLAAGELVPLASGVSDPPPTPEPEVIIRMLDGEGLGLRVKDQAIAGDKLIHLHAQYRRPIFTGSFLTDGWAWQTGRVSLHAPALADEWRTGGMRPFEGGFCSFRNKSGKDLTVGMTQFVSPGLLHFYFPDPNDSGKMRPLERRDGGDFPFSFSYGVYITWEIMLP